MALIMRKNSRTQKPKVGFIGQGFVGKSYADDFEHRGYPVVRYSLEKQYVGNKNKIKDCEVVFIAVPTPTVPNRKDAGGRHSVRLDSSILESVISLVGEGRTAVIRSTVLPGTTERIQKEHSLRVILHAPEFLSEATSPLEASYPLMNIIGIPFDGAVPRERAAFVLTLLPQARYSFLMSSRESELMKYIHNVHGFMRVVFANVMYDIAEKIGADWSHLRAAMDADPMLSPYYNNPLHKKGRGAGGNCFIKDFAAFRAFYEAVLNGASVEVLRALEAKNIDLLWASNKDIPILEGVYGKGASPAPKKKSK